MIEFIKFLTKLINLIISLNCKGQKRKADYQYFTTTWQAKIGKLIIKLSKLFLLFI